VIQYVVDHGAPKPFDDERCRQLEALGFRREGAYRAGLRPGEVWVDADGTTMVAVSPLGFGMTVAAQTVLEDGTHVTTEQRPPLWMWLLLGPGVSVPPDRTSLRFPHAREAKDLVARHREHVAEVVKARGSAALPDGTTARYAETRNEAQIRGASRHRVQLLLGALLGIIAAVATFFVSPALSFAVGFGTYMAGFLYIVPALMHRGLVRAPARRVAVAASKKEDERVLHSVTSRVPYIIALHFAVLALFIGVMALKGKATSISAIAGVSVAFSLAGMLALARNRQGGRARPVTYEIAGGELRVEGEPPIPLNEIAAVLRTELDKPSLAIVNRRGRVALRLRGPAAMLDELRDALALERVTLPVTRDPRSLFASLLVPLAASFLAAWALPAKESAIYSVGALLMMVMPLIDFRRRPSVEVGIDGMLLENRFVAFADIASLTTTIERLEVKEKNGKTTTLSLALFGSAAEIARRWNAHSARAEARDGDVAARRRVAVSEGEDVPYRARIATPGELGDALLDSAEDKSVRMRAARRLARSPDEDAARVRAEVEERVVDPDVRHALDRPKE
jgi:hypothetical protein